jgi:hypothetical protein
MILDSLRCKMSLAGDLRQLGRVARVDVCLAGAHGMVYLVQQFGPVFSPRCLTARDTVVTLPVLAGLGGAAEAANNLGHVGVVSARAVGLQERCCHLGGV